MNTFKNVLIAILTGLLALTLLTQPAQSATKTYDAVKLIQYDRCLDFFVAHSVDKNLNQIGSYSSFLKVCDLWKP